MEKYLRSTEYIDWKHPAIVNLAAQLADKTDADMTWPKNVSFAATEKRERDFPEIWPEPLPAVIKTLTENQSYLDVYHNLPGAEIIRTL